VNNVIWRDNSNNETGFIIESYNATTKSWSQIATVGPNVTSCAVGDGLFRVRAFNSVGSSAPSNSRCAGCGTAIDDEDIPDNATECALSIQ
jgi:hypothetical protein